MTRRVPCPPAPGLLEDYVVQFDDLLPNVAQRRAHREYPHGLLLPRERSKTLTGLAGTGPVLGAQAPSAQRLQWFLSESAWDAGAINDRRLELRIADPATRSHDGGVLVIDETGDRKDGTKTAHVAHRYLGSAGRIASGIVSVTSLWADEDVYYTPTKRLAKGKDDPAFCVPAHQPATLRRPARRHLAHRTLCPHRGRAALRAQDVGRAGLQT